jgi:drug/metabolite transporter (DMT)-like permease
LAISHLSFKTWSAVLFLGIFCSGVSYVLWAKSLSEMEATKTGAFLYFEPFVTVISAWLLLKENITALIIISGLIIMLGVYVVNRRQIFLN